MKFHVQNLIATVIFLVVSIGYYGLIASEVPTMQVAINLFVLPFIFGFVYALSLTGRMLTRIGYVCGVLVICGLLIFSQPSDPAVPRLGDLVSFIVLSVYLVTSALVLAWRRFRGKGAGRSD